MHPSDLLVCLRSSITTVKFLRRTCTILESFLSDEYEHLEKLALHLDRYLMHYGTISDVVFASLSRFSMEIGQRLETLNRLLHEMKGSTVKCTIWLKLLRSRPRALTFVQADRSPVGSLDGEFLKLCIDSIQLFSSIITPASDCRRRSINQPVNSREDHRSLQIDRSSNEKLVCQTVMSLVDSIASDVDTRVLDTAADDPPSAERETYAYESNLLWPVIVGPTAPNRVRLAIEAIEQQCRS